MARGMRGIAPSVWLDPNSDLVALLQPYMGHARMTMRLAGAETSQKGVAWASLVVRRQCGVGGEPSQPRPPFH